MNFYHYLHIVLIIGKYTDVFRRDFLGERGSGGGGSMGGSFHGGIFRGGGTFL